MAGSKADAFTAPNSCADVCMMLFTAHSAAHRLTAPGSCSAWQVLKESRQHLHVLLRGLARERADEALINANVLAPLHISQGLPGHTLVISRLG